VDRLLPCLMLVVCSLFAPAGQAASAAAPTTVITEAGQLGPVGPVTVQGDVAYFGAGTAGTHIYDIADPVRIREVGSVPDGGARVAVTGTPWLSVVDVVDSDAGAVTGPPAHPDRPRYVSCNVLTGLL
jgi:hypothetical protein